MHDGQTVRLSQGHHQRLLPVGHEARMNVGLHHQRLQVTTRVPEADAVVTHVKGAADLAVDVQEGGHVRLVSAAYEHVAVGRQGRRSPGGGLNAIGQGGVGVAHQLVHALDVDGAIGVHGDDGAHLL